MTLAARQSALARFLVDPKFEQRVRSEPDGVAAELGLAPEDIRKLAALSPQRVTAFRASQRVKERRRRSGDEST